MTNAILTYSCEDNHDGTSVLVWNWTDVPTDDREPGLDSYFVRVVNLETSITIAEFVGAEDNAYGEDYAVMVPNDIGIYVQVINDAEGFRFEDDEIVTCPGTVTESDLVPAVLPYTGLTDWLLPVALVLIAAGMGLVRLVRR